MIIHNREYTAEIMFESFNIPGLYIAVQVCSLISYIAVQVCSLISYKMVWSALSTH